jgi:hypothetical protein
VHRSGLPIMACKTVSEGRRMTFGPHQFPGNTEAKGTGWTKNRKSREAKPIDV